MSPVMRYEDELKTSVNLPGRRNHYADHYSGFWLIRHHVTTPAMTMPKPSSHSQYCCRKLSSAIFWTGGATATGGLGCGGKTAGVCGSAIGAGAAATDSGGATGAGLALGAFFLALCTFGLGAGVSATASGAGAGSGATCGLAGSSTGAAASTGACAAAGADTAAGVTFGSDAQEDNSSADTNRIAERTTYLVFDMVLFPDIKVE